MNIENVKQDIESWIINFLEKNNENLADWPPCPYARSARLKQSYDVRLGNDLYHDMVNVCNDGIGDYEVVIYAYDPDTYTAEQFHETLYLVNSGFLVPVDLLALDDHPDHVEDVNGVTMNQGTYALAMVQSLSDLNKRAKQMGKAGFYKAWPEEYLEDLFAFREDPRT